MKLYETYTELENIYAKAEGVLNGDTIEDASGIPITGEDALGWLTDYLETIQDLRDEKATRIGCFIKQLRYEAEALKAEKLRLQKRQNTCERTIERLTEYLEKFLHSGVKIKNPRCTISFRKSEAVNCWVDAGMLPPEFQRVKIEPDLSAIKYALKNGQEVAGAKLETKNHIQIK